jgi:hypothetical protein
VLEQRVVHRAVHLAPDPGQLDLVDHPAPLPLPLILCTLIARLPVRRGDRSGGAVSFCQGANTAITPWMGSICATRWRTRRTGRRWWRLGAGVYLLTGADPRASASLPVAAEARRRFGGIAAGVRRAA